MSLTRVALTCLALLLSAVMALAQDGRAELRTRQAELFRALTRAPADLELMFDYAVVSMRLEDYEPAIATLERMLIFNDDLPRVKLELAVAYFRLGVYPVSKFYFEEVLESDAPAAVRARISPFLDQIARRTAPSAFGGAVSLGALWSSNATLGPADREILADIFPGGVALLEEGATERPDLGLRLSASATHRLDLRRPNDDAWFTELGYVGQRYRTEDRGNYDAVEIRTGPRLALDAEAFGPKLRPFVEGAAVRAESPIYYSVGVGAEYFDTLRPGLSVFGEARASRREYGDESPAFDGVYLDSFGGVAWEWREGSAVGARLIAEVDRAAESFASNVEGGLRLTATEDFSVAELPGFERFGLPWSARAFVQVSARAYDEPDPDVVADRARFDRELRAGLGVGAPLDARWSLDASATLFERRSNIRNYNLSNYELGFSVTRSF